VIQKGGMGSNHQIEPIAEKMMHTLPLPIYGEMKWLLYKMATKRKG
jgi:hypothetical protein